VKRAMAPPVRPTCQPVTLVEATGCRWPTSGRSPAQRFAVSGRKTGINGLDDRSRNHRAARHRDRKRYADDYQVIWRGWSIGRIMQSSGAVRNKLMQLAARLFRG
jgi:hypothetical protein